MYGAIRRCFNEWRNEREERIVESLKYAYRQKAGQIEQEQVKIEKEMAEEEFNSKIAQATAILRLTNPLVSDPFCLKAESDLPPDCDRRSATAWSELRKACEDFINPNQGSPTYVKLVRENDSLVTQNTVQKYTVIRKLSA